MNHYTYILKCADNTLYTGYTNNIELRVSTHNQGKGAKYTKSRLPVELLYTEIFTNKTEAMKREYEIKQLTRKKKDLLIKFKSNNYIPKDKFDFETVASLDTLDDVEIKKIAYDILTWIQDMNWPIALPTLDFICKKQELFISSIQKVLAATETDELWKYWIITCVFPKLHDQSLKYLASDIKRLYTSPTTSEIHECIYEEILPYAKIKKEPK